MDDRHRKALDEALAKVMANPEPAPITLERIEDVRNRIDGDMLEYWDEGSSTEFFRPAILDLYMRWTRGELDTDPHPAMHETVARFAIELLEADNPRELITATKKRMDECRKPTQAKIVRCMQYFMEDGLSTTRAIETTMELLGIDSYDRVKQVWQRSPESGDFKRR